MMRPPSHAVTARIAIGYAGKKATFCWAVDLALGS